MPKKITKAELKKTIKKAFTKEQESEDFKNGRATGYGVGFEDGYNTAIDKVLYWLGEQKVNEG